MVKTVLLFALLAACMAAQTITLGGVNYNLATHPRVFFNGPSGSITTAIKDPDGRGPRVAPKASKGNPPWVSLLRRAEFWAANYPYTDPNNVGDYATGEKAAAFAAIWYSDNTQTAYRTAALDLLNNIEQYYPMFCDSTLANCEAAGGTGYSNAGYGVIYWNPQWIFAYELMRGEMTPAQRSAFASKWLNDLAAFGGVSGSPSTSCTSPDADAQYAVTVSGNVITASGPLFGPTNPIQVGYWVVENSGNGSPGQARITSILDARHATFNARMAGAWNGFSGTLGYRRVTWLETDCGIMWVGKHGRFNPKVVTYINGKSAYPTTGGTEMDYASNNTFAPIAQMMMVYLALADDDTNAAVRAQPQLSALYDDWYKNMYSTYLQHGFTGFHYTGSSYGLTRPFDLSQIPAMFAWSINGTPPSIGTGVWAVNMLEHFSMNWLPSCAGAEPNWGQDFGLGDGFADPNALYHSILTYAYYHDTPQGARFNWALRNRFAYCETYGNSPGAPKSLYWGSAAMSGASILSLDQWLYVYTDPSWPSSDLSMSGATAVALNKVDATSNIYPQSVFISRTGYSSVIDTLVNFYGMAEQFEDHNLPSGGYYPGAYKIFKGNYLLAADGNSSAAPNTPYSSVQASYHAGGSNSNYVEIGNAGNLKAPPLACGAAMPRSNTDGASNRFAYAMVDSTQCYRSGVSRAQRHLLDFKGGKQQFVIVYDDVATSVGARKLMYLHYPNNFGALGITDKTRGRTIVDRNSVISTNPGTGNSDSTQLLSTILAPGANRVLVYTDKTDGSYPGGVGLTFRVTACASADGATCDVRNTLAELMTIHEPATGIANSMPETGMITTDQNWRGVQISGSAAKVALFARNGQLLDSASFTSTHEGVAQVVLAGLMPGLYAITGPKIFEQNVGNDGVLYFEGPSGPYLVGLASPSSIRRFAPQVK